MNHKGAFITQSVGDAVGYLRETFFGGLLFLGFTAGWGKVDVVMVALSEQGGNQGDWLSGQGGNQDDWDTFAPARLGLLFLGLYKYCFDSVGLSYSDGLHSAGTLVSVHTSWRRCRQSSGACHN